MRGNRKMLGRQIGKVERGGLQYPGCICGSRMAARTVEVIIESIFSLRTRLWIFLRALLPLTSIHTHCVSNAWVLLNNGFEG